MTLISVADVARLIGVTPATVYDWIRHRQIPFIKIGGVIRFDTAAMEAWIESKKSPVTHTRGPSNV